MRRTESFRRAVSRYPSKNFDVRRTSSFHSARYANDTEPEPSSKCNDVIRYGNNCRVHSLQNISRKRDTDALCDHLVLHLPPETSYGVPKPVRLIVQLASRRYSNVYLYKTKQQKQILKKSFCGICIKNLIVNLQSKQNL